MEADRRLVQHVADARQPAADLRGQADALELAAAERVRPAVARQVVQAHFEHEAQPLRDLLDNGLSDLRLGSLEREVLEETQAVPHAEPGQLADVQVTHREAQGLGFEPCPVAGGAGGLGDVLAEVRAGPAGAVFHYLPQRRDDGFPRGDVGLPLQAFAVQQRLALRGAQLAERRPRVDLQSVRQLIQHCGEATAPPAAGIGPGPDGPFRKAQRLVRDDQVLVELVHGAQAVAARALPVRAVEGERVRVGFFEAQAALRTGEELTEQQLPPVLQQGHAGAGPRLQRSAHAVGQAVEEGPEDGSPAHRFAGLAFRCAGLLDE